MYTENDQILEEEKEEEETVECAECGESCEEVMLPLENGTFLCDFCADV